MAGFCPNFCLPHCLNAHIPLAPTCTMTSEPGSDGGPKKAGRPLDCITSHFTRNVAKPVKNNRWWWTCKYCETDLLGRDDNLAKHILATCRGVPEQTRAAEMARVANEPRPLPKKQRILTCGTSAGQETLSRVVDPGLSSAIAQQANKELLRACATGTIPFRLVDNPHFCRFLSLLRPSYVLPSAPSAHTVFPETFRLKVVLPACCVPQSREAYLRLRRAGRESLRTTLLTEEFMRVQLAFKVRLERSGNLTLALDGRTSARGQSLYAVNVLFPDRTVHVLAVEDLSLETHTAAYLTGARCRPCNLHLCTRASQRGAKLITF